MGVSQKEKVKRLLELLPKDKIEPECPHVKEGCGGCLMQEWNYEDQLDAKKKFLKEIYGTGISVVACPNPLGYRNRMDFTCSWGKKGLRKRGNYKWLVDVKDCFLLPEHARGVYRKARDVLERENVEDYDYVRHRGFLRYLVIRSSRTREESMLILTTASPQTPEEHASHEVIFQKLMAETGAKSVHWMINDGQGDVSIGERYKVYGQEFIMDDIADKQFMIFPETFFQANTRMAEELFLKVKSLCKGNVLDLYCGVGVIALLVHDNDSVTHVTGVEFVEHSIVAAKENATLNRVPEEKCDFFTADVSAYLKDKSDVNFNTVICDPNRPGLGGSVCEDLLKMGPEQIIYISCNPTSHKEDLARLSERYEVTMLEAHDLFPQTPHIEILSVLKREN